MINVVFRFPISDEITVGKLISEDEDIITVHLKDGVHVFSKEILEVYFKLEK